VTLAKPSLDRPATEETVAAFRKELGLDKPAYIRYFDWVAGVIQGDLGTSFSGRAASGVDRSRPVAELIAPRLWNTLFLAGHDGDHRGPACTIFGNNSRHSTAIPTTTKSSVHRHLQPFRFQNSLSPISSSCF
jgi:hypothetical protein